jgi:hypothetical protein
MERDVVRGGDGSLGHVLRDQEEVVVKGSGHSMI